MKGMFEFVKTTLIGGVLVILPMAVIVILLAKVLHAAHSALRPLAASISDGVLFPYVVAALLVVLVCFLAGLVFRTSPGRRLGAILERRLYERVPGYNMLKAVGGGALAGQGERAMQPAFADLDDGLVPVFIMERHADGRATVFLPSSPAPTVGSLYVLAASKVHPLDVPMAKFMSCLSGWGVGTKDLLSAIKQDA
jgi:uncharacterized membrane protein